MQYVTQCCFQDSPEITNQQMSTTNFPTRKTPAKFTRSTSFPSESTNQTINVPQNHSSKLSVFGFFKKHVVTY